MKNLLICLVTLLALSGTAHAQYSAPPAEAGGSGMSLFGMGEYENLGESIFIGALYIPQLQSSIRPGSSARMEMRIIAGSLSARRFTQLWMDAITLSSSRDERVAQAEQIQKFGKLFQDSLLRGDKVSFEYLESDARTTVTIDEVRIGTIPGAEFFNILLASWIGNTPLSGQLKAGILRQIETDKRIPIKRQFAETEYTEERRQQIVAIYAAGANSRAEDTRKKDDQATEQPGRNAARVQDVVQQGGAAGNTESLKAANLEAARMARLEAEKVAQLEEEARLEAERVAKLEEERIARLEEETRLAAEKVEADRLENERVAAERVLFEMEQKLLSDEYRGTLIKLLRTHIEYPQRAQEREQEGRVELSISINRSGEVVGKEVITSSDNALLDQAALKALERGSPLPAMPENLVGETYTFTMPVSFSL